MVLQLKTEIGVERGFVFRVGGLEPVGHVSEGLDHVVDLFLGEDVPLSVRRGGELLAGGCLLVLGGGDPAGYDRGGGSGIQCGAVLGDALLRVGEVAVQLPGRGMSCLAGGEDAGDPGVEGPGGSRSAARRR
ncbi:hypothetical protein ACFWIY_25210 [Streptomyces sioyaensis]|uniref:hypothetical protein n=1 Tax=Streptomyces sioyaensis TaxID=67364 RepID=UPI003664AAEC